MTVLEAAVDLQRTGRFRDALRALESSRLTHDNRIAGHVLKAALLFQLGRISEARELATELLRDDLSLTQRSSCEYVLGKVFRESGQNDLALEHLHRSTSFAKQAKSLADVCRAQLSLMLVICESCGSEAAIPLIAEIRSNVIKLGDARTTAALHVFVGETEAKRGLLTSAYRHVAIALELLQTAPNLWLESIAENLALAIAIERADFRSGLKRGLRALDLAEESGNAAMRRACLANLGNVHYALGEFDRATDYFDRALKILPSGAQAISCLANLARARLGQGRIDESAKLLDEINDSISTDQDRAVYAYRYAGLTRSVVLFRQNRLQDAVSQVESVLPVCDQVGDQMLKRKAQLTKAEIVLAAGKYDEFRAILNDILNDFDVESPQLQAQCERILRSASAMDGDFQSARLHSDRAQRICQTFQLGASEFEMRSRGDQCISQSELEVHTPPTWNAVEAKIAAAVIQSIATIAGGVFHPELIGREVMAVLEWSGCAHWAALSSKGAGDNRVLVTIGQADSIPASVAEHKLNIGEADGAKFELAVRPRPDTESAATLNAITRLLSAVRELQRVRSERDERSTLWPVDELPAKYGHAIISGHMRELMTLVQRVAKPNINIMIFGESGTGKEIIARAIHDYSDRAKHAFVPLNCAAVPRELMESQLFGHRRGAFTGADRDFAGCIRAAHHGTLFLDEIAELSLDLQPKLLRFLESGEIAPLGEPAPLTVNVRVLAATNKNLEELVREGKFREDLFYRLNVVPLSIRPLRERRDEIPALVQHFVDEAAVQFKKGHLTVAEETIERLLLYRWPGNVRQLQHEIQRIVALAEPNSTILPEAIAEEILGALPLLRPVPAGRQMAVSLTDKLPSAIARIECEMIKLALRDNRGKVDAAAKALGISRKGLYLKRQRLGL